MKKINPLVLERLNRKYSYYGQISDASIEGSTEVSRIPWNVIKEIILERDEYRCRICGRTPILQEIRNGAQKIRFDVEVHHIIPRIAGGTNSSRNLITLCKSCHIKTFKNNYKGIPVENFSLGTSVEIFTDSAKLLEIGNSCESLEIDSFFFKERKFKISTPIKGSICGYSSLNYVYDYISEKDILVDEIVIKNKKGNLIIGLIENYQPI